MPDESADDDADGDECGLADRLVTNSFICVL